MFAAAALRADGSTTSNGHVSAPSGRRPAKGLARRVSPWPNT